MNSDTPYPESNKKSGTKNKKKDTNRTALFDFKWAGRVAVISLITSFCLSYASEGLLDGVNYYFAVFVLLAVILLGILFDILGTATATADPKVINSMATRKRRGAKTALSLISNAASVTSFCNDVIGDTCGIVSGSMCVVIASGVASSLKGIGTSLLTVIITAIVSALTIGGKAMGKNFAMTYNNKIVFFVGKALSLIKKEK